MILPDIFREPHHPGSSLFKTKWLFFLLIPVLIFSIWTSVQAGTIVTAGCAGCGFDSGRLFLFGGRANFKTVCQFPAYCPEKRSLVSINLLADNSEGEICPGRIPYTDPKLMQHPGTETIASWNLSEPGKMSVWLTDGDYLCPRCGQFLLHFYPAGYWD